MSLRLHEPLRPYGLIRHVVRPVCIGCQIKGQAPAGIYMTLSDLGPLRFQSVDLLSWGGGKGHNGETGAQGSHY